uniref:subtilisin n=1 Tax=Odontella aurita TaxID=265563 RepID=A0A7S4KBH3_9STRA
MSGAAALIRQYFGDGHYPAGYRNESKDASIDASGTLVKAVLLNSGVEMEGRKLAVGSGTQSSVMYDSIQGFGRVNLTATLRLPGKKNIVMRAIDRLTVKDGEKMPFQVVVNNTLCGGGGTGKELRATLVWADPPGSSGCTKCLINDLDLTLIDDKTGKTYYPNDMGSGGDHRNNVERIVVPATEVGEDGASYTATVDAYNLDTSDQQFSLVMSGCFNFDGQDDFGFAVPSRAGRSLLLAPAAMAALLSAAFFII